MINNFEKWFASTNENLLKEEVTEAPQVSTDSASAVGRKGMMHDVDAIMTSLDALSVELTEELEAIESGLAVNEAGAGDAIKQWFISMKAAKAQQKVNKIKMNATDLEFAADQAGGDKAKAISGKVEKVKLQATELQKMVDDKYGSKGAIVSSRISKEKIKGQLEIIKRTTGMEDDPKKKADLKTKMKELAMKAKEEDQAIEDFEDKNAEEIQKERERIEAEAKAKKEKAKKEAEGTPEETPAEETPAEETPAEETPAEETPEETPAEETPEETPAEETPAEETPAEETPEETPAEETPEDEEDDKKGAKEALVIRANAAGLNELASQIDSKLDWQVAEGSVLRSNYEAIIKKAESDQILNESKYKVNSIKDAFKRLM